MVPKLVLFWKVWAESFGIMPRNFQDTMTPPFWGMVAAISGSFYLDQFCRTWFVSDLLELDEDEEELIPDEPEQALTSAEKDQLILEEMVFPGAPATEAARRAEWRRLPQRTRVAIRRLHRSFDHLPGAVLEQILRQSRASPDFIKAAKLHRCKVWQDVASKPRHHPVSSNSNFDAEFNHTIGADSLEIKDSEGKRYTVLNFVDLGANFQQAIILKAGGGNPTAQACLTALQDHWFHWAGLHKVFIADRGTSFRGELATYLAQPSVQLVNAPLETPQTIGKVERHGGILKAMVRKVAQETAAIGQDRMREVLAECVSTKNEMSRHQGFSPSQHVLGKMPRTPGLVTDEPSDLGAIDARYDEAGPFYTRHRARTEARRAFVHLDTSRRVARALIRNAAPVAIEYNVGDLIVYRRDNVPGVSATVWSTASRVIGKENDSAIWVLNEGLPILVSVHKLRPADEVEVAAHRILGGEPVGGAVNARAATRPGQR